MIAELAKKGKRMRQKRVSRKTKGRLWFLTNGNNTPSEDKRRKAYTCYYRKIRDVSYMSGAGKPPSNTAEDESTIPSLGLGHGGTSGLQW